MGLGWFGNIFIVAGLWYIGNQKRWAFLLTTFGEVIWILHSYLQGQTDLMVICILFAILQFRGWLKFKPPVISPSATEIAATLRRELRRETVKS